MTETASRTAPRIASITTYAVSYPLEAPMADAVHYIPARAALLVEVACDDGLANKQIARHLGISERTVKPHLTSVFQRIGVTDRTQAALWAERNGLRGPSR